MNIKQLLCQHVWMIEKMRYLETKWEFQFSTLRHVQYSHFLELHRCPLCDRTKKIRSKMAAIHG
jgi:hypothetical protein